jgi:RNA polymerase sigma-70 factor (ECF subfamily)
MKPDGGRSLRGGAGGFDPEPWRGEVLSFVRRMGGDVDSEDIVQDAMLRAVAQPPETNPRAYIFRIALNALRDRRRRDRIEREGLAREGERSRAAARAPDPAAVAERRDLTALAWRAAVRLPEKQKAALILRVRRSMEYEEIAEVLSCSVATARQHFHLAVKAVRNVVMENDDAT